MPRPKGLPKTGGRRPGSRNRDARLVDAAASRWGITPKEYFLRIMRDPKATQERRDWAAAQAAPYVHPRLQAIESKVEQHSVEMRVTRAELAAEAKRRIDEAFREYEPPKTIDHVPPSVDTPATLPEPPPQEPEPKREPVVREYARPGPLAAAPGVTRLPMRYRPPRPVGDWSG